MYLLRTSADGDRSPAPIDQVLDGAGNPALGLAASSVATSVHLLGMTVSVLVMSSGDRYEYLLCTVVAGDGDRPSGWRDGDPGQDRRPGELFAVAPAASAMSATIHRYVSVDRHEPLCDAHRAL